VLYEPLKLQFFHGEFVGLIADNTGEKIKLKMFHAEIINDADKLTDEVTNKFKMKGIATV
jgi:hypothetical protein